MRKLKRKHIWMLIGVIFACVLLLYWLFEGTYLEEQSDDLQDVPPLIENTNNG